MAADATTPAPPAPTTPAPQPNNDPEQAKAKETLRHALGGALASGFSPLTAFVRIVGEHMIMLGQVLAWTFRRPFRAKLFVEQAEYLGVASLPIITLVGTFTGAVTALQAVAAFRLLKAEGYSGSAVGLSLAVELGPVLTGLMLSGRVG